MKKLKSKYRKQKIKPITPIILLKIEKKKGRWCEYYSGRLPYPLECQWNSDIPLCHKRPNCKHCKRKVQWAAWKTGEWSKIKTAIENGEDLTDMPAPNQEMK